MKKIVTLICMLSTLVSLAQSVNVKEEAQKIIDIKVEKIEVLEDQIANVEADILSAEQSKDLSGKIFWSFSVPMEVIGVVAFMGVMRLNSKEADLFMEARSINHKKSLYKDIDKLTDQLKTKLLAELDDEIKAYHKLKKSTYKFGKRKVIGGIMLTGIVLGGGSMIATNLAINVSDKEYNALKDNLTELQGKLDAQKDSLEKSKELLK